MKHAEPTDSAIYRVLARLSVLAFQFGFDWRIHFQAPIPPGPLLIAANHASFLDPPLLGAALYQTHDRVISYLARKTLFDPPLMSWLLPRVNAYPIDQDKADAAGLKKAISLLRHGHSMIIFPEGARTPNGKFQPVSGGVGLLVAKAQVPVLPARIFGAFEAWPRFRLLPRLFVPIDIVFGTPMDLRSFFQDHPKAYDLAARKIMDAIIALHPPDGDQRP